MLVNTGNYRISIFGLYGFLMLVLLLFGWKITIIESVGSGIRIDDILIFLSIIPVAIHAYYNDYKLIFIKPIKILLVFFVWSVFVGVYNYIKYHEPSIVVSFLFSLRHIEYAMIFYVAYYFVNKKQYLVSLDLLLWYLVILSLLQVTGLLSGLTAYNVEERVVANTAGPWELAVVVSLLLFFNLERKRYFYAFLSLVVIYLTYSRITIAAVILVIVLKHVRDLSVKNFISLVLVGVLVLSVFLQSGNLYKRYEGAFSINVVQVMSSIFDEGVEVSGAEDFHYYDEELIKKGLNDVEGDASLFSRVSRWALALNVVFSKGVDGVLLGRGAGFFGLALDGYYLRLIVEVGLFGFIIYMFFISSVRKMGLPTYLKMYFYVVLVTAIFIDILVSYKAMGILWLALGVECKGLGECRESK